MGVFRKQDMTQFHYPANLAVTVNDFRACGWKEALQNIAEDDFGYSARWTALSKAARSAMEADRQTHAKALWLLADACSMMLRPGSLTEPFTPFAVFHDRRSALPEDFNAEALSFFGQVIELVDDSLLKARLADLLWLVGNPRQVQYALAAIDAYRIVPLTPEVWVRDGQKCWERAFALALTLGKGAGDRVKCMLDLMLDRLWAVNVQEHSFGVGLAKLLRNYRLVKERGTDIAEKLEALARAFDEAGNISYACSYFEEAANWFDWVEQQDKHAEMTAAQAETYVRKATFQVTAPILSNMIANSLYEKAIQIYRNIPGKFRATCCANERIAELRRLQGSAGERALDEMGMIRGPTIDITELIDSARKAVSDKEPLEALRLFANIASSEKADKLRASVIERMQEYPLQRVFESIAYSQDGRVIAKRPVLSENDEKAIQSAMVRDYGIFLPLAVQGGILPALEVLRQEHRLREADFIELSQHSPIVPTGRAVLFGKALHAGYDGDFVVALHLLVPQIEHMVRTHLKQAGAMTTTLDKEGIENENGLSTLLALPETTKVFGKDLSFEFQALFCDPFGPNLRNHLAHGLLDDGDCRSVPSVYAWWLGLKLVFNTWWNAQAATPQEEPECDKQEEAGNT
jgi:hypothetical protein